MWVKPLITSSNVSTFSPATAVVNIYGSIPVVFIYGVPSCILARVRRLSLSLSQSRSWTIRAMLMLSICVLATNTQKSCHEFISFYHRGFSSSLLRVLGVCCVTTPHGTYIVWGHVSICWHRLRECRYASHAHAQPWLNISNDSQRSA